MAAGGGKRVTVEFNKQDWKLIERATKARSKERGYPVTVSELLRELVREKLGGR